MSEKGHSRKSMFSAKNMEELRRLYGNDTPVLAMPSRGGRSNVRCTAPGFRQEAEQAATVDRQLTSPLNSFTA